MQVGERWASAMPEGVVFGFGLDEEDCAIARDEERCAGKSGADQVHEVARSAKRKGVGSVVPGRWQACGDEGGALEFALQCTAARDENGAVGTRAGHAAQYTAHVDAMGERG